MKRRLFYSFFDFFPKLRAHFKQPFAKKLVYKSYPLGKKGIMEKQNKSELRDLKSNYERLIEKYGLSSDEILSNFATQMAHQHESAEMERARQLLKIKEKLRKKKVALIGSLEQDEIDAMKAKIAAQSELDSNTDSSAMTRSA